MKYQTFTSKMREDLLKSLKLLAAAEGRPMQALLEDAVSQYLNIRRFSQETLQVREAGARYSISFDISPNKQGKRGENTDE